MRAVLQSGLLGTRARQYLAWLALAAVYAITARLCLALDAVSGFATLVWPPSGLALAALVASRYRLLPGVFLGAFLVNRWVGAPAMVALGIAAGNTAEAWVGARLMLTWRMHPSLDRLADVALFIVGAALGSTLIAATMGTLSLYAGGMLAQSGAFAMWRAWWVGDGLGDLVVAPALLVWWRPPLSIPSITATRSRILEAALLSLSIALAGKIALFGEPVGANSARHAFVLFPVLTWAALRFGMRGATASIAAVSTMAIVGTVFARGPFADGGELAQRLLVLQAFTAVVAVTVLLLGAAIEERTRAVSLRDQFLAIVSHDLRNPLGAIQLRAAQLERRGRGGESISISQRDLESIVRATNRMDRLVRDLTDLAAIEAGKLSVRPVGEDLVAIGREAVESFHATLETQKLLLRSIFPTEPLRVVCDRERVLQVLANLVDNAMKFTPKGGTVTIEIARSMDAARVCVSDTGMGMSAEDAARVFDAYWQGPGGEHRGMGLGLFIARRLVEAHTGRIWMETGPDRGSRFYFTLPLESPSGAIEEDAAPRALGDFAKKTTSDSL